MPQQLLASVPSDTHQNTKVTPKTRWTSSYNIAAWLQIESDKDSEAQLVLRYEDMEGKKNQTVDNASVGQGRSTLLSGVVDIKSLGAIKAMSLFISTQEPLHGVNCEEVFVRRSDLVKSDRKADSPQAMAIA